MKKIFFAFIIIVLLAVFFIVTRAGRDSGNSKGDQSLRDAMVESIDILLLESFPVQVNVVVNGNFPDSCTEIGVINEIRKDNVFSVAVKTSRPKDAVCAQVITPFEQVIPLSVTGLKAGTYTVDVNGVKDKFVLEADNFLPDSDQDQGVPAKIPAGILD